MIVKLIRNKWKSVSNLAFQHPNLPEELVGPLRRTVVGEIKEYCRDVIDSMLQKKRPEELAALAAPLMRNFLSSTCSAAQ